MQPLEPEPPDLVAAPVDNSSSDIAAELLRVSKPRWVLDDSNKHIVHDLFSHHRIADHPLCESYEPFVLALVHLFDGSPWLNGVLCMRNVSRWRRNARDVHTQ